MLGLYLVIAGVILLPVTLALAYRLIWLPDVQKWQIAAELLTLVGIFASFAVIVSGGVLLASNRLL